jgi:galactitol PTS system EIIA component
MGRQVFGADLCLAALPAKNAEGAIRSLAAALERAGHVGPSFVTAALTRERRSPTGLPFPGVAVALPHAEPEHVLSPAVAVASLAAPVRFRQMGAPAVELEVRLVVMPALTAKEQAAAGLSRLIELLQDESLRARLAAAATSAELASALAERWKG